MKKEDLLKEKSRINTIERQEKNENKNTINTKTEDLSQNDQIDNESEGYPDIEKTIIDSMKLEIIRLKENLSENKKQINDLIEENNKLKLSQIEISKTISSKDNIINSNKIEINKLQTKNIDLESKNNEKKKIIQELNYKIIELNQKIETNESINKDYYEKNSIPDKQKLLALILSKLYYNLEDYTEAVGWALKSEDSFNITEKSLYVNTILKKMLDKYIEIRKHNFLIGII